MDDQQNLTLRYGPARFGDLLPHVPWVASDYNTDGHLDEATDFAAFMVGWNVGEWLANSDFDNDFDQDDIDLWLIRFQEDFANE